jgi:hypothetical protein
MPIYPAGRTSPFSTFLTADCPLSTGRCESSPSLSILSLTFSLAALRSSRYYILAFCRLVTSGGQASLNLSTPSGVYFDSSGSRFSSPYWRRDDIYRRRKHFMKGKIISIGAVVLLALASAWAADVTGKWIAHAPGAQGQGDSEITLVFKVDGENLTGTLNNSLMPGDVVLNEGKLSGDDISFSLVRKFGENEMKIVWTGKISGDEIKFTRVAQGGMAGGPGGGGGAPPTEIIAKRAK